MAFSAEADIEALTGLEFTTTSNPTSAEIATFISMADQKVIRDITRWYRQEKLDDYFPSYLAGIDDDVGERNGVNKVFFVRNTPVADQDASGSVTVADIRVDQFDDDTDTWSENVSVASVDARRGKITLTTAPGQDDNVYSDYRTYIAGDNPDTTLLKWASVYQASIYVMQNRSTWAAGGVSSYSVGGLNVSRSAVVSDARRKVDDYEHEYNRIVRMINSGEKVIGQ